MSENFYKKATQLKLRFKTAIGNLTVEDLWDLPLKEGKTNLNSIAQVLDSEIQSKTKNFVDDITIENSENDLNTLRFNIVIDIIKTRVAEKKRLEQAYIEAQNKQQQNAIIDDVIRQKTINELNELSLPELNSLKNK